jgi:hypothetical protein
MEKVQRDRTKPCLYCEEIIQDEGFDCLCPKPKNYREAAYELEKKLIETRLILNKRTYKLAETQCELNYLRENMKSLIKEHIKSLESIQKKYETLK